jgi:hypothetical protein
MFTFTNFSHKLEARVDFAIELMRYLLEVSNAKDKGVRFRSCQMVAGLIQGLEEIEYV